MDLEEQQQQQKQKRYQIVLSCVGRMSRKPKIVLPEEIIHYEILTRLPAKYLVQFQLVCRSWKSLFTNSEFVNIHLTRQNSYKDQDLLIGHRYIYGHGVIIITRSKEISVTVGPACSDILLGSINGLVCMASGKAFCLWNPALGKLKEVCLPSQHSKACRHLLGFSWDHIGNDYKVVIICYSSTPRQLSIYSYSSASWTEQPIPDSVLPDRRIFVSSSKIGPSTIVKGTPYWSFTKCTLWLGMQRPKYISVFKFLAESNELRSLPNLSSAGICGKIFNLVNIKDRLTGLAYERECRDSFVDIYHLDEESHNGVWSKMYTIGPIDLRDRSWLLSQCFKNGGEILINEGGLFSFYNPETKKTKSVESNPYFFACCYSYTPSLVCVQGMEADAALFTSGKRGEEVGSKLQQVG